MITPSEYYGSYYGSYAEDGSAIVWCPKWYGKETRHANGLKQLIKGMLNEAPMEERTFVAKATMLWCNQFAGNFDDHDMSCVSLSIYSDHVGSGRKTYNRPGVGSVIDKIVYELCNHFIPMKEGITHE